MKAPRLILALVPLVLVAGPALRCQEHLELGKMWTFENPPLEYLQQTYGWKPTPEWLDAVRLASLRLPSGCSASFVSPNGLIMTNHHCVRDAVAKLSPPSEDWIKNGFYARSATDERKIQGFSAQQLVAMKDVTTEVNEGIDESAAADVAAIDRKRQSNLQKVLAKLKQDDPDLLYQPVGLYNGAVWEVYSYKSYNDIRLVCTPNLQTAHFGGDPDNFTYPRYGIDFSFVRAYEDNKPADTKAAYFRWSKEGPKEGELTFVTGNPGNTGRLLTMAQLARLRDVTYPIVLGMIDDMIAALEKYAATGEAQEQKVRTEILGQQNSQKALRGYLGGLQDKSFMARKGQAEAVFKAKVDANEQAKQSYGAAFGELEDLATQETKIEPLLRFLTPYYDGRSKTYSKQLEQAVMIVRATSPDERDSMKQRMHKAALDFSTTLSEEESVVLPLMFVSHVTRAQKWLPPGDKFLAALLHGMAPKEACEDLQQNSKMNDKDSVKQLLDGGWDAVKAATDPAVQAAVALVPEMLANSRAMNELQTRERVHNTSIGKALFAVYGTNVSPDATFTLRFSDGLVEGYPYNGTIAPWRTSFYSMYGHNVEFGNKHPFDLPQIWLDRKDKVDMTRGVDFVSKNDIIGGNSGSPIINTKREVVGLIFDGNIEMLPNNFLYTDERARAVSVHVHAIMEALRKIYDADRIADELESGEPAESKGGGGEEKEEAGESKEESKKQEAGASKGRAKAPSKRG